MDRQKPELADIFRRYGKAYLEKFGASVSAAQRRVMKAIESCRTAVLGGHLEVCDSCGHQRVWYNSCSNRHCPKCQSLARAQRRLQTDQHDSKHIGNLTSKAATVRPAV